MVVIIGAMELMSWKYNDCNDTENEYTDRDNDWRFFLFIHILIIMIIRHIVQSLIIRQCH